MAAWPYKLYGGATRADAISGLDRRFSDAMLQLYNAAPPGVQRELGLNSAYRNAAIQQELWDKSDKSGHSVARPGKSKHQHGTAADLYGFGLKGGAQVSPETRAWVHANAANHGLYFPMSHEPWHIQLVDRHGGPVGQEPGAIDLDVSGSPLAATLASAITPVEEDPFSFTDLATSYAKRANKTRAERAAPGLMTPSGGTEAPINLTAPAATIPSDYLAPSGTATAPAVGLAELFQVKDIGNPAAVIRPGKRF